MISLGPRERFVWLGLTGEAVLPPLSSPGSAPPRADVNLIRLSGVEQA